KLSVLVDPTLDLDRPSRSDNKTSFARSVAKSTLELHCGESKTDSQSALSLQFIDVLRDERCPRDERSPLLSECYVNRGAAIKVLVTRRSTKKSVVLDTHPSLQQTADAAFEGYQLHLTALFPSGPKPAKKPDCEDYTATIEICSTK